MSVLWGTRDTRAITKADILADWGTGDIIGGDVGEQLIAMFAATRLLADGVASLPLRAYQKNQAGRKRIDLPSLFESPSLSGVRRDWVYRCIVSLVGDGNAFGLVTTTDAVGYPTTIEWIARGDVRLEKDDILVPPVWHVRGKRVDDNTKLIHIAAHVMPGKRLGLSPVQAFKTTFDTGKLAQIYGRDWFSNSVSPSGIISTKDPLTDPQAMKVKRAFKRAARNRDIVVLPKEYEWKDLKDQVVADAQFLAAIRATATQVASIYGIPPEMIGGESGKSLTYATVEQNQLNFVTTALTPYLRLLEEHFEKMTPRGQYVRFNAAANLRADFRTKFFTYQVARNIGLNSVNELRALEDLEAIPAEDGGDDFTPLRQTTGQDDDKDA